MRQDLMRLLKSPVYWLILCVGVAFRAVMAYMDFHNRGELYWNSAGNFWSTFGAVTLAFVVLIVGVRLFSEDYEYKTDAVILSTVHGRKHLFWRRMAASVIFTVISAIFLAAANIGVTYAIGAEKSMPAGWTLSFAIATGIASIGGAGLSIVSGSICDQIKSHGATLCICGLLYGISFFVNGNMVNHLETFWFLKYGFFTELIRGRWISTWPVFWTIWYCILVATVIAATLKRRKERKEL